VGFRCGASQGNNVDLVLVAEKYLGCATLIFRGQSLNRGMRQNLEIGGQRPEALINYPLLPAKITNGAVILGFSIKTVLDNSWFDIGISIQKFKLLRS